MIALIGIPLVLLTGVFLYRFLARWMERRDAGTFATFAMFAGSCCIFISLFLPLEFPRALRFFSVLTVLTIPFLGVRRSTNSEEPLSLLQNEQEISTDFFEKGDCDL